MGLGGDVSPGHPRVPRLPPEGSAPPGAVPAGDGSGAKLRTETPHVSGGSLLHLALIRKKSSPVLFQIWKRALQLSLDLGLDFRAASLRACHLRAKREPDGESLPAASGRAGRAGTLRGVPGLPWASGHRWTSSCSQAGAVQELEARTRCGSAPGPVEEELERSHLPWQRARGLAGARLGSWEQPLKPLALALQAPEPAFSFLFIRKLQHRFLEIYLVFWGCRGWELAFALAEQQELRTQWCCSSILWSPRVLPLS